MAENLLKQLTKINMLNIIIMVILSVWMTATLYCLFTHKDLSATAQSTINDLKNIMLMVLGFYLKNKVDELKNNITPPNENIS